MNVTAVREILRERIGLNADTLGRSAIENPVAERMRALKLADADEYARRLRGDNGELKALVEEVVVVESWFFRGGQLAAWLAGDIAARPGPVRVLSIPCCTGEEPYSLRLSLIDRGVPSAACSILGVDLSTRVVEAARLGCFAEFSFRETPAAIRERHFAPDGKLWQIADRARENVEFRTGNLVAADFLAGEAPFDIVICRNVMIYLDAAARLRALANLRRLLAPGGLLAMGHAEPLRERDFESAGPHELFLYRRRVPAADSPARKSIPALKLALPPKSAVRPVPAVPPTPPPAVDSLAEVQRRADAGDLAGARDLGRSLEAAEAANPEFHRVMGVLHLAHGEAAAARDSFRRVLYLKPDCAEALVHLMHLSRAGGDLPQAELYRRRWERLTAGGEK